MHQVESSVARDQPQAAKGRSVHAVKVSNRAAQKQHKKMFSALPISRDLEQTFKIFALEANNADGIDVAEFAFAHHQCRVRDFHRIIRRPLSTAECFQQPACFASAAAAQFGYRYGSFHTIHNFSCVPTQQTLIGSREAVFGKMTDYFKQCRSHIVV